MENLLITIKTKNNAENIVVKSDLSEPIEGIVFTNPMSLIDYMNSKYSIEGWEMKNI